MKKFKNSELTKDIFFEILKGIKIMKSKKISDPTFDFKK